MDDVGERLLKLVGETFRKGMEESKKLSSLRGMIDAGKATYADMDEYATLVGRCLTEAFSAHVSDGVLPNAKMYYNIAEKILKPTMMENYEQVAMQCARVQESLNAAAGIRLRAVKPGYNSDRMNALASYISDAEKYSDREKQFLDFIEMDSRKVVDDSVKANADFHYNAGLHPKVIRVMHGPEPCKWCRNLAGIHDYPCENDVFKRHANCYCTVTYDPADGLGQVQDFRTRKWRNVSKQEEVMANLQAEAEKKRRKGQNEG